MTAERATVTRDDPAAPARAELAGTTIGRYLLLRELGAGGAGVVWAAHDPQLDREVAIKLLRDPTHRWDTLIAEARVMARLDHPNIVTVHDAGRSGERVYLVMELVDGGNTLAWLRERAPGRAERVAVLLDAARGLAAAHAAGIVHRDMKPGNVLVDRDGRARVTDFGLARPAEEEPADERATTPAGTPLYLAPERYTGAAADARSDQYSFCVGAVELLAGAPPFACALDDEAVLLAAKRDERFAAEALAAVPRALRGVLARGLAADPARRWPSMDALVAAIAATRRRRWPLAVAGGGALAVAIAAWALWPAAARACAEEGARTIDRVVTPARLAAYRARMVAAPARAMLWPPIEADLRAVAHEWNQRYAASCGAPTDDAQRTQVCLADRAAELDTQLAAIEAAPDALLAQATSWIGELRLAVRDCDRARAIGRGDPALRRATDEAAWLRRAGRYDEARALAARTVERARAAHDEVELAAALEQLAVAEDALGTLDAAARDVDAAHLAALRAGDQLAASTTALFAGQVATMRGQLAEAASWLDKAEAYLARFAPDGRDRRVADLLGARAQLARARGDETGAIALYRREVALREQLFGARSIDTLPSLLELGQELGDAGAVIEAIAVLERARAIAEAGYGAAHPTTANALASLADPVLQHGDRARAIALLERAVAILRAAYGPRHARLASSYSNLAVAYQASGDLDHAADFARQAVEVRRAVGPDEPATAAALRVVARIDSARGRYDDARREAEAARALAERVLGAQHPEVAAALRILGGIAIHEARWAECRDHYAAALAIQSAATGANPIDLLEARDARAWCRAQLGELEPARAELAAVVDEAAKRLPPAHPRAQLFQYRLAEVLRRLGRRADARELLTQLQRTVRDGELRTQVDAALARLAE